MPDKQQNDLERFVDRATRQLRGEEPPLEAPVMDPGDVGYVPPSMTPADLARFRRAMTPPEADPDLEADTGQAEAEDQPREELTEIGKFIADRTTGWFPDRTPVRLEDLGTIEDEMAAQDAGGRETAADFLAMAQESGGFEGLSPEQWVAWAATCPEIEWRAACDLSGWDPAARPSYRDVGTRSAQVEIIAADLERALGRLRAQGRHIE